MKSIFRSLPASHTLIAVLLLAPLVSAQEKEKPDAGAPPVPPPAAVAPVAPVEPAAPVASAAPVAEAAPAVESERPLRRIDEPVSAPETKSKKSPSTSRRRSSSSGSGEPPFGDHTVALDRKVREAVSILGVTLVNGEVERDAVSVLGRTVIGPGGKVGGSAVAVLGPLESKGTIGGDAVSVFGGVDIDGHVRGELVSVFGDMRLGPNAVVDRDIVLVGGKLTKDPAAIVRGNQVNVPILGAVGDMSWLTTWFKRCVLFGRPLAFGEHLGWAWLVAFSFLGLYLFIALLFRGGIEKCVTTLETRPGMSILSALLTVLLSPVVMVLLVATVVGLIVVPFVGLGLAVAKLVGKVVMLAWLGRRLTRLAGPGSLDHPVFAVLIGGLIVMLLYTVPVFGFLLYKVLSWVGLGVVVYTLALAMKRETPPAPVGVAAVDTAATSPFVAPVAPDSAPFTSATVPPPVTTGPAVSPGFGGGAGVGASGAVAGGSVAGGEPAAMAFATAVPFVTPVGNAATPPPPAFAPPAPASAPAATAVPPPFRPAPAPGISASTYPRAGLMIRLGALALDGILIGMILGFVSGMLPRFLQFNHGPGGLLLVLATYGAVMWKHKGTTIGGIVCGLKVVRTDHREIDWATAIVRALGCFLSLIVAGLGFLWVAFDPEKQSWHDKIAGTTVVRVPKGVSLL